MKKRQPLSLDELRTVDTHGAFELTGIPVRQFEAMRLRGGGPPFLRFGKLKGVRYRVADISKWIQSRERSSTSDPGPTRSMRARPKNTNAPDNEGVVPRLRNFHGRTGKTESSNHADPTASG